MKNMFGRQPELGVALMPLADQQPIKTEETLLATLPESERVHYSFLMQNLEFLLANLIAAVGEEEAARFLYNAFGLPEPEILELATPVHLDLTEKLIEANNDVERRVYAAKVSLSEVLDRVERMVVAQTMLRLQQLEKDKEVCEASSQKLEGKKTAGETNATDRLEWKLAHQEKLAGLKKEIALVKLTLEGWFDFSSRLKHQLEAVLSITTKDIAAPNPELVYSGSEMKARAH